MSNVSIIRPSDILPATPQDPPISKREPTHSNNSDSPEALEAKKKKENMMRASKGIKSKHTMPI